jgi:hypothetical protein
MHGLHSKVRILRIRNLQVQPPGLFSRAFHRWHRLTSCFQVLEFRRIVIAPSL